MQLRNTGKSPPPTPTQVWFTPVEKGAAAVEDLLQLLRNIGWVWSVEKCGKCRPGKKVTYLPSVASTTPLLIPPPNCASVSPDPPPPPVCVCV